MSGQLDTCWDRAQLCSLVSRASGEQPIGSAPRYGALLVLSVLRPWPRNAFSAPGLPGEVQAVLAEFSRSEGVCSLLAVEPDPSYNAADDPPEAVRALHFRHLEGPFAAFERREWLVPKGRLAAFLREGWGWAELPKTGRVVSANADEVTVELEFRRPNGEHGRYRAVVRATGEIETLASSGDPKRVTVTQYEAAQLTLLE